ncbi:CubicO group peptidase (beta-lactamase class C family) [Prauserella rugosa]|uniref:CubicO group peptidase (Beta-lactamase class C family) n=2 Tax=Prauserella rugosa TaxID=43354 RepID=A0A660CCB6_9PSEU|nr:CubicO group peptidase (beta-lactamase class C family) [Prauserella rugosa]
MRARIAAMTAVFVLTSTTTAAASTPAHDTGRTDPLTPTTGALGQAKPKDAGVDPRPIRQAQRTLADWTAADAVDGHPLYSGAAGLLAHDGKVVGKFTAGGAVRFDRDGNELPADQQVPVRENTIFDMASVSKLFTSIAVMQLVERGDVELSAPVARYLPAFGSHGKDKITVEQLLTHTSGLEATMPLWKDYPDRTSRIGAVLAAEPVSEPGTEYEYSDLNLITLGELVGKLTGERLDTYVQKNITGPLGMRDTGYNPPKPKLDRIAATEYQSEPDRGMIRGVVHDENAWSLDGVAGHAGIFSTIHDMGVLGQALLNGGTYDGARILSERSVRDMLTNRNQEFPDDSHGLGFELDQSWYMGELSSPNTAGHTGFTGTSFVIDPNSQSMAILLTNKVHPTREWGSINDARTTWATAMSRALKAKPNAGADSWFRHPEADDRGNRPGGGGSAGGAAGENNTDKNDTDNNNDNTDSGAQGKGGTNGLVPKPVLHRLGE